MKKKIAPSFHRTNRLLVIELMLEKVEAAR